VRSDRSQGLSLSFFVCLLAAASLIGFVGASVPDTDLRFPTISLSVAGAVPDLSLPAWPTSTTKPPNPEEQRYLEALLPLHLSLQQNALLVGFSATVYRTGEIDRLELKRRLDSGLATYRRIEDQVRALEPPPQLQTPQDRYLTAVRLLQQSAIEMLKTGDDGDPLHLSHATPLSLDALARLHVLGDRFWPAS
jgi:hypothetical protein